MATAQLVNNHGAVIFCNNNFVKWLKRRQAASAFLQRRFAFRGSGVWIPSAPPWCPISRMAFSWSAPPSKCGIGQRNLVPDRWYLFDEALEESPLFCQRATSQHGSKFLWVPTCDAIVTRMKTKIWPIRVAHYPYSTGMDRAIRLRHEW